MRSSLSRRATNIPTSATVQLADTVATLRSQGEDIVDFSAGRAAEHTPEYICEAAAKAMASGDTHQTMAQGTPAFRRAIAAKLARDNGIAVDRDKSLIATLGCKQGLLLALLAAINHGDEVIVEDPTFVSYEPTIRLLGGQPVRVPLRKENRFRWTRAELAAAITRHTRAIIFCSPHNPCGVVHSDEDLDVVADVAREHDLIVIADETYERLTWDGRRHVGVATRPDMHSRTITLMGLTKAFCMGGWRIGFALAPEPMIQTMVTIQQHLVTCPGSFAQAGAAAALTTGPPRAVRALWADWEQRCSFVVQEINQMTNASCAMPEAGFYAWIDITRTRRPSNDIATTLLKDHQVAVVPGSAFGEQGEGYVRLTCVRSWEELRTGLKRMRTALG